MPWGKVTKEHVEKAIARFLEKRPEHYPARNTFLVYNGEKLPAKHIRGMAYEECFGRPVSRDEYTGGGETQKFFVDRGYTVEYKGKIFQPAERTDVRSEGDGGKDVVAGASPREKIQIPVGGATEQKEDSTSKSQKKHLFRWLNEIFAGNNVVREKRFDWMRAPDELDAQYLDIFNVLREYRGYECFYGKSPLPCDFVIEKEKLIVEYDERQHFTEARRLALSRYRNIPVHYDRDLWIKACEDIQAQDNDPPHRDEQRAFYDSVRDIQAHKHGYRLIRIMHGKFDFAAKDALAKLRDMLKCGGADMDNRIPLKVGLYLQTGEFKNDHCFREAMNMLKNNDFDILVFPEDAHLPTDVFDSSECSLEDENGLLTIKREALAFSKKIGRAVVICSKDERHADFSVYANAHCKNDDTKCEIYVKHTASRHSAFEFANYDERISEFFKVIVYKGFKIGLTICYDCNHSAFSRMYGVQGVDIIINSTGGNVEYIKWKRFNKVRSIENNCYTFVTMGGNEDDGRNYVFGFNREGGELIGRSIGSGKSVSSKDSIPGDIYIYDLSTDTGKGQSDDRLDQRKTRSKKEHIFFPVNTSWDYLATAKKIKENLYVKNERIIKEGKKKEEINLVIIVVDGDAIFKPESHLTLLYDKDLQKYDNKRYLMLCRYGALEEKLYAGKLSDVLKVRAAENYCAVILESKHYHLCCLPCRTKNVQVIEAEGGKYILDAERMKGPELIWENKRRPRMRRAWRGNFEALVRELARGGTR